MIDRAELQQDVGQILWFGFEGTDLSMDLASDIAGGHVGAVVLFSRNLARTHTGQGPDQGPDQRRDQTGDQIIDQIDIPAVMELTRSLHQAVQPGRTPLWIAMDQEGGPVQRVRAPATVWPPMQSFDVLADPLGQDPGQAVDEELAERVGQALGKELAALGVDVNFAPVLDVHTNAANPIIGKRAFGTEPERVARRGLALARGLELAGIASCGKHFPGHGDTATDSHLELPRLDHGLERLEAIELVPFQRAVAADIPMLMTAHVVFAALDASVPATLSHAVITGLLRERMGYQGIVVSDDLDMKAIATHFGIGDAAVRAIEAGCDVLLLCRNPAHQREAREALIRAGEARSELRRRIAQAAQRVRQAKARQAAALARCGVPPVSIIGCSEHQALAQRLAGKPAAAVL